MHCLGNFATTYAPAYRGMIAEIEANTQSSGGEQYYPVAATAVVVAGAMCDLIGVSRPMRGALKDADKAALLGAPRPAAGPGVGLFDMIVAATNAGTGGDGGAWGGLLSGFMRIFRLVLADFHAVFVGEGKSYMDSQAVLKVVMANIDAATHPHPRSGAMQTVAKLGETYAEKGDIHRRLIAVNRRARFGKLLAVQRQGTRRLSTDGGRPGGKGGGAGGRGESGDSAVAADAAGGAAGGVDRRKTPAVSAIDVGAGGMGGAGRADGGGGAGGAGRRAALELDETPNPLLARGRHSTDGGGAEAKDDTEFSSGDQMAPGRLSAQGRTLLHQAISQGSDEGEGEGEQWGAGDAGEAGEVYVDEESGREYSCRATTGETFWLDEDEKEGGDG
jgi:hypothetical protein